MQRILFLLLLASSLQAQQFSTWSLNENLPQSQVFALCEDAKGYLWIGTQGGGVCRFDGIGFDVFTTTEGLPSNYIQGLYEDRRGRLWVGTNDGLCFFDGKRFQNLPFPTATIPTVYVFLQVDKDRVLVGTSEGLWQFNFQTQKLNRLPVDGSVDREAVYALHASHNAVWLGAQTGLWRLSEGTKSVNVTAKNKMLAAPVYAIASMGSSLFYVDFGKGIVQILPKNLQAKAAKYHPELENTVCLAVQQDGTLWAGGQSNGLFHLSSDGNNILEHITESEGLPHNHVRVLLNDHNQRLWVGTSGGGFAHMGSQAFRRYDRSQGLPGARVYALAYDKSDRLWISGSQNGLAVLDSTGLRFSGIDTGYLQGVKTRSLAVDTSGNLWAGTEGKGVMAVTRGGRQFFTKNNGFLPSDFVNKIVAGPHGEVWVGTSEGLVSIGWRDSTYVRALYTLREGLPAAAVTAMQFDKQGRLWFGTAFGQVGYLLNGRVEQSAETGKVPITALALDGSGRCWVATKGKGLFVNMPGNPLVFETVKTPQALASQNLYLLVFDADGRLWAGSENGVDRLSLEKGNVAELVHFGKNEGFTGIETCQDAALLNKHGRLWMGTMNGLMLYLPNALATRAAPPKLHLEAVSLFYKPIEQTPWAAAAPRLLDTLDGGLKLPWNQNHLSFAFRAVELLHDDGLLYRWKLENAAAAAEWSPWSEQNQVNYANLSPGVYRLWVQASGNPGAESKPILAMFTIEKPFWELWTFRLTLFALLAGLVFLGVRWYVRGIREREAEQREKLEVQHRLLQLEQKALQLQMNPHFIFNALNSIQSLIATQDYDVARREINQFAKLMRSTLNNSRKTAIGLKEEMETLEQYLLVEQFCQQNAFTFEVHATEGWDPEPVEIPPMLLQPFVENAVVHGVSHLTYPGHLEVLFDLRGEHLVCFVRDNGVGREKAALLREAKKPGHQSAAMQVTKERLEALGGSIEVRDMPEGGTEVEVHLPVEVAF